MKGNIQKFVVFTLMLVIGLAVFKWVPEAAALSYGDILGEVGEEIELPGYDDDLHGEAYEGDGLDSITSSIYYVLDFIKYILGGIAVLFIIISSYRLLTAGEGSDEEINKQKEYFTWAIIGLIIIFMADTVVKEMFYGEEGEIFTGDEEQALSFATQANAGIKGIYTLLEVFVGAIAVWAIAYDGVRMIVGSYSEEEVTSARKHIFWSLIGLVLIGLSELIVKDILFRYTPEEGVELGISEGKLLIANLTNFVSGLIGFVSVGMLIYGGYLYMSSGVSEENTGKAKKIIMGAILGIIMAGAAFAIASSVIPIEVTN